MSNPTHIVVEYGWHSPTHYEPHWSEESAISYRDRKREEAGDGIRWEAYKLVEVAE